jgi:hypothetical protein
MMKNVIKYIGIYIKLLKRKLMKKNIFLVIVLLSMAIGFASADQRNPLAFTSWEPRPMRSWLWGTSSVDSLDFNENTFTVHNRWGVVARGTYSVSGNTITLVSSSSTTTPILVGTLSGGRLIIRYNMVDTVFHRH